MFRAVALDKLNFPLQGICVNPEVARRLPFSLACRYQALPVAEDDGHLTVAMAHPNDVEARRAILAALPPISPRSTTACPATECSAGAGDGTEVDTREMSVYLVRGDPVVIDSLLADAWPGRARRALRLLVVDTIQGRVGLHDYAQALGRLLGAEASFATCDDAAPPADAALEDWPKPLKKLLLVVQGDDDPSGPAALAWAVRLARRSSATVTILAAVPPGPPRSSPREENGLAALLTAESTVVSQVAQKLVQAGIAATLRLRQGSLDQQLHREVIETHYDLVLVSSKPILTRVRKPAVEARPPIPRKKETDHVCDL
jgi:nucleotide-binding universal stress UspA family protein